MLGAPRPLVPTLILVALTSIMACSPAETEESASSTSPITQARCQSWDRTDWLTFHDDRDCQKVEPSNKERTLSCPNVATDATGFSPSNGPMQLDDGALSGIVDADIKMTAILIRRINGVPHYHYMSNGTAWDVVYPWSTSKFMAVAFAAQRLRQASGGAVGLTASTSSNQGPLPLGDLATIVHSYEPAYDHGGYPSNGLARYFLNIADREHANENIHGWLGRTGESFGANYGAFPPADLGYTFRDPTGATLSIGADTSGYETSLSTWTLAETLKRLAMWDDAATRLPGLEAADLQTLFYGAADSRLYAGQMGGMSADLSRVVQAALDMKEIDRASRGRWRNFGKLGQGTPERGNPLVDVQYACLPVLDGAGNPVPNEGAEFVVSSFIAGGSATENDARIAENYRRLVQQVILPRTGSGHLGRPPSGTLVTASCEEISGTTTPDRAVTIRIGADPSTARAYAIRSDASGQFRLDVPRSAYTGTPATVWANADGASGPTLDYSGATIACRPSLEGTLRHVATWDAFVAWQFDLDRDVAPVDEVGIAGRPVGPPLAGRPVLVQIPGEPTVFAVESENGDHKHGVPSMEALRAWRLAGATIYPQAASAVATYPARPNLRARPELVRTPEGAIFMVE